MFTRLITMLTFLLFAPLSVAKDQPKLTVFAAASLTDVLPKVAAAFRAAGGQAVVFNFDGSSKLARQIKEGAPADLFFSANVEWMDYLDRHGKLAPGARKDLFRNELVLAVPAKNSLVGVDLASFDFSKLQKLALAGENVPAGIYAQAALEFLGAWSKVQGKIVRGDNVRTVLAWLALGEVQAGVVYATDAKSMPEKVKVAGVFLSTSHPPIVYPGAIIKQTKLNTIAAQFLEFCRSKKAMEIFNAAGFQMVDKP